MKIFGSEGIRWQNVLRPIVFGLIAGGAAVLFQNLIHFLYANGIERFSRLSQFEFLVYSLLSILGTSLLAGVLVRYFCPSAAGSGSPQMKLAFWKDFGRVPWRTVWVKFIGSALSIGGGASLGNEGPMVQIGGGIASVTAGKLGVPAHLRRMAGAAGSAAGLAAIFNAPMAAVAFVLEEVLEDLNSRLIGSILLAAVTGALVAGFFMGDSAVFSIKPEGHPSWWVFPLAFFVAAFSSAVGVAFQKMALWIRAQNVRLRERYSVFFGLFLSAFFVWGIGSLVFIFTGHLGVFFLGYADLTMALNAQLPWVLAGILLLAKLLSTAFCYGLGGVGGIFAPALFFGGMCGACLAGALNLVFPLENADLITLAVVGMCGCFGSIVRAPVTGVLLVFEMTHDFTMLPALMLGGIVSISVSKWLSSKGFYDEVLAQDGIEISKLIPPRDFRAWQSFPVERIANLSPISLREFSREDLPAFLGRYAFSCFPILGADGRPYGLVLRGDLERFLREEDFSVPVKQLPCCSRKATVAEAEGLLVEAEEGMVALVDENGLFGVLTLHDILRAEMLLNT